MKMMTVALCGALLAGCASRSENIAPSYISPAAYSGYSCKELGQEAQRVSEAAARASGAQDSKATKDAVATGVAVIVFWPAAFLISGDGQSAAEVARLKGQMSAIEEAAIAKKCNIRFQR